jgi:hypothetical protein
MRPVAEMQRLRSVGRLLAVAVGGLAAIALVHADAWYALAIIATMGAAAATHRSHWYVTPAFSTFLVCGRGAPPPRGERRAAGQPLLRCS